MLTTDASYYQRILHALKLAVEEQVAFLDEPMRLSLYEYLMQMRLEVRWYYLSADMARDKLWPMLRADEPTLDFILNLTMDWTARIAGEEALNDVNYVDTNRMKFFLQLQAANAVAGTMGGLSMHSPAITDPAFSSLLPKPSELIKLLAEEGWLTTLLLLTRHLHEIQPHLLGPVIGKVSE
jgi:hypothetical protein